ncbi:putative secreted protein (Por secretion system target) [Mariniflexile fucanivorans]|uniref:Putative secreted protein (Por secretion system target) n=1 Tax=Mariniflexile fucanivorans TaxID=264023 RepID=A0A4R1RLC5_9FLAO|nr:DUF1501 domain-containing protein [Mariniflexile fucanivorans]TCL67023.1 putative secreted protein (Por secretion system target) [Mariniflexile fucanivorans]
MKRRNFIKLSASATAIGLTPFQLQAALKSFMTFVECPDISNRKLVIINLSGANDGLNTIIPLDQYDMYSNLRPTIKVPISGANKYINLDTTLPDNQQIGLNPALTGLKSLYDKGWLRILQSVGYPSQNKSHFKSADIYLTGNDGNSLLNGDDTGWMGRFMELFYEDLIVETYPLAVEIGSNNTSLGFHAEEAHGLAINISGQDPAGYYSVINGLGGLPPLNIPDSDYGDQLRFLTNTDAITNTYAQSISNAFNSGKNSITYPDSDLSNQLKTVARLISGDLGTKVYMVRISGFDTHNKQVETAGDILGTHHTLLSNLSGSIEAFINDLNNQNLSDDVVGVTFSEFGRKAAENGNLGTDHGEIAPMFVFGKPVSGGVSGTNPDLKEAVSTNNYQLKTVQYDYRQTFATLLQNFLGADNAIIDSTFFNHTLNESFNNLKVENLIKGSYDVSTGCTALTNNVSSDNKNWLVYPNPCHDTVYISGINIAESVSYKFYNASGILLIDRTDEIINGKATINLGPYSDGVYFFQILAGSKKEVHKVIKI